VLAVEGEPAWVLGLVGPLTDFHDGLLESRRFVVHVLGAGDRHLAELFAGRYPSPNLFDGLDVRPTAFGPVVADLGNRAFCDVVESTEVGYSILVKGRVDHLELEASPARPLAFYRGAYAGLDERPR
jgi:flavin reductase (DIM6/NTAB) family NADH-FMN oxidoreductase RutF